MLGGREGRGELGKNDKKERKTRQINGKHGKVK
jgi:hypothetical protein